MTFPLSQNWISFTLRFNDVPLTFPLLTYLCIGFEFRCVFKQGGVIAAILVLPVQVVKQTDDVVQTNLMKQYNL